MVTPPDAGLGNATVVDESIASDSYPIVGPGETVGRYLLVDLLGRGGMGSVYRGYDPELDRMVAIKLVHEGGTEASQLRLQREAQAIAKLSHPNVVQVYDVGRLDGEGPVFIAMEYVAGQTLRRWLEGGHPWTEVLDAFVDAGRGLAAAHQRGVVHRDFKPENVLVERGGRAKVLDFGLAKAAHGEEEAADPELQTLRAVSQSQSGRLATAGGSALDSNITRVGARLGTPAYMPPEQYSGLPSDARADQFSFAVALWEGLYGELPFAGTTVDAYAFQVLEGQMRSAPRDTQVPRHVHVALVRALDRSPSARHADMEALLDALIDDPGARGRRRLGWSVAALSLAGLVGAAAWPASSSPEMDRCAEATGTLGSSWNPARREAVERALRDTGRAFANDTAERVGARLDGVSVRWASIARDACRRGPDAPLRQARAACLDRSRVRLERLADALEHATDATVEHAIDAVARLESDVERCEDPGALERQADGTATLDTPELRSYRTALDDAELAGILHDSDRMGALLRQIPEPRPGERWPTGLLLDRARLAAQHDSIEGRPGSGYERLERAARMAVGGGEATLTAAAFHNELANYAWEQGELDTLDVGLHQSRMLTEQALGPDHPTTLVARAALGHIPYARGDYSASHRVYAEVATELATLADPLDEDRLTVDRWAAEALDAMSRHAEAIASLEDVYRRHAEVYGAQHPDTLDLRMSLGRARLRAKDADGALADFEAVLAGYRAEASRNLHAEAVLLGNIGGALAVAERWADAREHLEQGKALLEDADDGALSMHRSSIDANLAAVLTAQGEHDEARALLEACVAQVDKEGSDASHNGVMMRLNLARSLGELGEPRDGLRRADEALARARRTDNPVLSARAELRRAQLLDELARRADADAALIRARELLAGVEGTEERLAEVDAYEQSR